MYILLKNPVLTSLAYLSMKNNFNFSPKIFKFYVICSEGWNMFWSFGSDRRCVVRVTPKRCPAVFHRRTNSRVFFAIKRSFSVSPWRARVRSVLNCAYRRQPLPAGPPALWLWREGAAAAGFTVRGRNETADHRREQDGHFTTRTTGSDLKVVVMQLLLRWWSRAAMVMVQLSLSIFNLLMRWTVARKATE